MKPADLSNAPDGSVWPPLLQITTMDPDFVAQRPGSGGIISARMDEEYRWMSGTRVPKQPPTIHDVVTWNWPARPVRIDPITEPSLHALYSLRLAIAGWVDADGVLDPERDPDPEGRYYLSSPRFQCDRCHEITCGNDPCKCGRSPDPLERSRTERRPLHDPRWWDRW